MASVKIVLAGDAGVGKTSLLLGFAEEHVPREYVTTIGVDFRSVQLPVGDHMVKVNLWDTAGQERYRGITGAYYRGAHAVVLIYDVTREETFANLHEWVQTVQNKEPEAALVIVGNKSDLEAKREVPLVRAEAFAKAIGAQHWEVSWKSPEFNQRIKELVGSLGKRAKPAGFQLEKPKAAKQTSCSC